MKIAHLDDMVKGWFVGDFDPSVLRTSEVEVSVKEYETNAFESRHFHKIATEITVIAVGKVKMNGVVYGKGDIIVVKPFESTDFEAIEHTITTVVKYPGASDDKYLGDPP